MVEFPPPEERMRRVILRRVGAGIIASIYLAAAAFAIFGGETMRWSMLAIAIIAPPLIVFLTSDPRDWYARSSSAEMLTGLSLLSAGILIASGLAFGSDLVRTCIFWTLAAAGGIGIAALIVRWILADEDNSRRRLLILLIVAACLALLTGALLGPPMLRWISIGTGAAFLAALFSRDTRDGGQFQERFANDRMIEDGFRFGPHAPWKGDRPGPSLEPRLGALDQMFASAQRLLYERLHDSLHENSRYVDESTLTLSIAALDNIRFISSDAARSFNIAVNSIGFPGDEPSFPRDALRQLLDEIAYARSRLRAHGLGAHHPALELTRP